MLSPRTLTIVTAPLLLVGVACGDDPETRLEIDAMVDLCPAEGSCAALAASGARFTVSTGDAFVIERGVLSLDGTYEMTVDPGAYAVRVTVDGLAPVKSTITISDGETGGLSMRLTAYAEEPR